MSEIIRGIAFAGPMGSGKTTASEYLRDKYNFSVYSFATPIKNLADIVENSHDPNFVGSLSDWLADMLDSVELESDEMAYFFTGAIWAATRAFSQKSPFPRREFLQVVGTDIVRDIYDSTWVDYLLSKSQDDPLLTIDDVRFPDELRSLSDAGVKLIWLEVGEDERRLRLENRIEEGRNLQDKGRTEHASEKALDGSEPYYYRKIKADTLDELYQQLDDVVEELNLHERRSETVSVTD